MRSLLCLVLCAFCLPPLCVSAQSPLPLTTGMDIHASTRFRPGTYTFAADDKGAIRVTGKGFTLDFKGVELIGKERKGVGLALSHAENITIKNLRVSRFLWGVRLEHCKGVTFIDCTSSFNGDLTPGSVIDESGTQPEDQWGGGFLLRDSDHCKLLRCTAQYQWDGVDVVRSHHNTIEQGDNSYSGNWGIHLWNSSNNIYRKNRAVWCTTGAGTLFQALTGWSTMDAQAVGIDHNSNENLIEENDLRFGGDAIFIRANEGGIQPGQAVPPKNSSDRNILRNNDCSFSPNNAIEVDFVEGTVIEGNNCSYSNYGMWLGYSRHSIVRNNICIDDSSFAVEIENGQFNQFENNIFGFSKGRERPNGQLVFLRQNRNDTTPSQGYVFRNNLFYGARTGVRLVGTSGAFTQNRLVWHNTTQAQLVEADSASKFEANASNITSALPTTRQSQPALNVKAGSRFTLTGKFGALPPLVMLDGVPLWVISYTPKQAICYMPTDYWLKPTQETATLEVFDGSKWVTYPPAHLAWNTNAPRITSLSPTLSRIGGTVTLRGKNLSEGRILLNNQKTPMLTQSAEQISFRIPDSLIPRRYNLIFERGEGFGRVRTEPIVLELVIPRDQLPHILSATFSPTHLKVGEVLQVEFVVKNNLPIPARLSTNPKPPYTYDESKAFWEIVGQEEKEALHLRVTSDHPGSNHPGSWPWLFGFEKASLAPSETTTVKGFIRVQTAGTFEFRVGLVPGGHGFIDDNAFRTKITIEK